MAAISATTGVEAAGTICPMSMGILVGVRVRVRVRFRVRGTDLP